jgi:hypothetical protein
MKSGDTFVLTQLDNHLWIVLSDPSVDSENVVIVNLTTHTLGEEQHCVLKKGDHPFLKHKTAVRYWQAKTLSVVEFEVLVKKNLLRPNAPLSPELLDRIRDGASQSTSCRLAVARFLKINR